MLIIKIINLNSPNILRIPNAENLHHRVAVLNNYLKEIHKNARDYTISIKKFNSHAH